LALEELAEGRARGLVVAKLDRLSRSVIDFANLIILAQERGWAIIALDLGIDMSTPHGRLVANILVAFAEWERLMIAQRTRDALAAAKAAGVRLGRPSGVEPETVAAIVELREAGCTLDSIADVFNQQQIPTAQGGQRWRVSTVRGVLTRRYEQTLNDESTDADARLIA
jgi:DNA invertase Pin-like site-specific DNA recombinase